MQIWDSLVTSVGVRGYLSPNNMIALKRTCGGFIHKIHFEQFEMNLHLRGALANVENTLSKSPLLLQNKRERSHVRHGEKAGLLLSSPCLLGLVAAKTSPLVPKPGGLSELS